ncbi:hypothetical protein KAFR_0A04200 [Kazachstania africana CBS 2517]|uniref:Serine hydrolase domain-containing protein n=1 Tax=Kazachstania africana (strain ATCC 22294 / BCRC 22015 / CBS 2517 / CECT 1963 / NBRC 1671 / NRRL Y-8276) TaxID=1071382 RepID=H2ANA5_KAZAF|nr:hypothetical protein KAFR_0A04200 [Kazachstania africana CBS 2517]CCF55855.1 hypothetical protein KAFR_0A04200 [Kazachstania africana CBS 2517]
MNKILMLHGFLQSDKIFSGKTGGLRKALKKLGYELHYPCGTEVIPANDVGLEEDTDAEMFGWFVRNKDSFTEFEIKPKTINYLREYIIKNGPFDGIIGFSQGAGLGGYLATNLNGILNLTTEQQPLLKFFISFSGFRLESKPYDGLYETNTITIPALHVLGELDEVVTEDRVMRLYNSWPSDKRTLLKHAGSHFVPNSKPFVTQVCNWIRTIAENNVGPATGSDLCSSIQEEKEKGNKKDSANNQLDDDLMDMMDSIGKL